MSGLSIAPITNADGGLLLPGMLVRQVPGGAAATITRAQANNGASAAGNLYVVEFTVTVPGGLALADIVGRKRVLLETGLTPANGDVLYLSSAAPGRATNLPPASPGTSLIRIGTVLDASTYAGDNSVVAVVAVSVAPFTEMDFAFGGGPSGQALNDIPNNANFWLLPTTNNSMQFTPGSDSTPWEWGTLVPTAVAYLIVNVISWNLAGSAAVVTVVITKGGTPTGVGTVFSGVGQVQAVGRVAVNPDFNDTIGVKVTCAGSSGAIAFTDFTVHARFA